MVTIKTILHPVGADSARAAVCYRITSARTSRYINTGIIIRPQYWDNKAGRLKQSAATDDSEKINSRISNDLRRLNFIIGQLDSPSAMEIVERYKFLCNRYSISRFMRQLIDGMLRDGRVSTARNYTSTLNCFSQFLLSTTGETDIMIDEITPKLIVSFQAWCKTRRMVMNTVSFYNRVLRAVYNQAVVLGATPDRTPFRNVYTGVARTTKRAVPLSAISAIRRLDLQRESPLDYARDMFLLSFYLRGMSFVDMAFLKKTDVSFGRINYRRRKTGQPLSIAMNRNITAIIDKYPPNPTDYLFPIITRNVTDKWNTYRNISCKINYNLKTISQMAGLDIPLTLYVARHSWATAARDKGIPLGIISQALGHDSEATTQIYLASIDSARIDRANALIIDSID